MTRKRYDGLRAALGASLTNSATTITFAAPLTYHGSAADAVPTLTALDYLPLGILDSDGVCCEVVWLTAYTAGAMTGTIVRGKESSTGIAHASGDKVVCSLTARDLHYSGSRFDNPDDPLWGADLGYDLEFELDTAAGSTLPSGYSWVNQGTSTFEQKWGKGILRGQTDGFNEEHRMIVRAIPTETSWSAIWKMHYTATHTNWQRAGMVLRQSSSGKFTQFGRVFGNSGWPNDVSINDWTNTTTFSGGEVHDNTYPGAPYFRIDKASGGSYDFLVSYDGLSWDMFVQAKTPFATYDQIGFVNRGSNAIPTVIDWLRIR